MNELFLVQIVRIRVILIGYKDMYLQYISLVTNSE